MKKNLSFFGRSKADAASSCDSDIPSGFDSDGFADAFPPNGEDLEDIFPEPDSVASGTDEVPLPKSSSRGRKKGSAISSPTSSVHLLSSARTRDILSLFVMTYRDSNPGSRLTAKGIVDEAVSRYLKKLSPETYARVVRFFEQS